MLGISNGIQMASTLEQDVASAATKILANSPVLELRYLRVDHCENELRLLGRVRSFYHKQLAQEAVRPIAAGMQVVNRVSVNDC